MAKNTRFVGLDVHAETIVVAVAEGRGQARSLGTIPNRGDAVERLLKKIGKPNELRVCYEAGPTGYALYWQLTSMGIACEVIAPSLAPTKPGDRVKTDRRDAERLARSYQSGDLTVVWVPDAKHEALRDLVRTRGAAKEDSKRAKHRLGKYLLRYAQRQQAVVGRGQRRGGSGCASWSFLTPSRTRRCWSSSWRWTTKSNAYLGSMARSSGPCSRHRSSCGQS